MGKIMKYRFVCLYSKSKLLLRSGIHHPFISLSPLLLQVLPGLSQADPTKSGCELDQFHPEENHFECSSVRCAVQPWYIHRAPHLAFPLPKPIERHLTSLTPGPPLSPSPWGSLSLAHRQGLDSPCPSPLSVRRSGRC